MKLNLKIQVDMPTDKQLIDGWKADYFLFGESSNSDQHASNTLSDELQEEIIGTIELKNGE